MLAAMIGSSAPATRFVARTLLLLAAMGASACPDKGGSPPPTRCEKAYEKCTLSSGVLGVCDTVECAEGQPPPCLVCRSQH